MNEEDDLERKNAEKIQRNIDFIIQQQAQFAADIQKVGEVQKELSEAQDRTEKIVERLATATLSKFENLESEFDSKMSALVDAHIRLADVHAQTDEKMNALVDAQVRLADSQAHSDEKLNAFIAAVERLINERRNGK